MITLDHDLLMVIEAYSEAVRLLARYNRYLKQHNNSEGEWGELRYDLYTARYTLEINEEDKLVHVLQEVEDNITFIMDGIDTDAISRIAEEVNNRMRAIARREDCPGLSREEELSMWVEPDFLQCTMGG